MSITVIKDTLKAAVEVLHKEGYLTLFLQCQEAYQMAQEHFPETPDCDCKEGHSLLCPYWEPAW